MNGHSTNYTQFAEGGGNKEELRRKFKEFGQDHVFKFESQLAPNEANDFWNELAQIKLEAVKDDYMKALESLQISKKINTTPLPEVCEVNSSEEQRKNWEKLGYKAISEGKVCMLLLAGGQGTRLGTTDPKGMYNIGLLSGKSLYQIQAERLLKVQKLTKEITGKSVQIPWYIMTSDATRNPTIQFFKDRSYFQLDPQQFFFFEQEMIPCLTPEGKILMESKVKVARSPNGNGGLYEALKQSGALDDMSKRGIEYVFQYSVDNSLIKMADPVFIGYCAEKNADLGVKVTAKLHPAESVGVVCLKDGKPGIVEYSEIDKELTTKTDPVTGKLIYNAAHVCMNIFSLEFLKRVIYSDKLKTLPYHIAKKKIPAVNEKGETQMPNDINGWKLELFFFDIFEFSERFVALEVERSEEFSPLKNGPGSAADSPETCRRDLSNLHKNYIRKSGGKVDESDPKALCEISPLVSFSGEGLEPVVSGKEFKLPLQLQ